MRNLDEEDEKRLIIWLNGKKVESTFEIRINKNINSLIRLKDSILTFLEYPRHYIERIIIYNYKGLEIDDVDIPYLANKQVLYVSLDGSGFNVLNYIYEYEFVRWIKSGGYGKVFLGKHLLKKDYYVAIKKIETNNLSTDEIYNISREALYLQSFQHKNIIKYINSYIYENHFYTVMDFAAGGELVGYLSEHKILSESDCKRIFKQVHDAVRYIHSRNVIHRDLKPNNILFLDEKYENVVLIDFGISGYSSGNIKEEIKAWTTKFIPPELASGLTYSSSPKFDIWALGVILFIMLFGVYPFDGSKDSDIITKIMKENHKFPSNIMISKAGYNLLNGLLEKNPGLRIEINDVLFEEWYNCQCSDKPLIKEEKRSVDIEGDNSNFNKINIISKAKMIQPSKYEKFNKYTGGGQLKKGMSSMMNAKSPRANSIGAHQFKNSYSNCCSSPLVSAINLKKSPPRFNGGVKVSDSKNEVNAKKDSCNSNSYKKTSTFNKEEIKISSFNRLGISENKI